MKKSKEYYKNLNKNSKEYHIKLNEFLLEDPEYKKLETRRNHILRQIEDLDYKKRELVASMQTVLSFQNNIKKTLNPEFDKLLK